MGLSCSCLLFCKGKTTLRLLAVNSVCCFMCPIPVYLLSLWKADFILLMKFFAQWKHGTYSLINVTSNILSQTKQIFKRKNFSIWFLLLHKKILGLKLPFLTKMLVKFKKGGSYYIQKRSPCGTILIYVTWWSPMYRISQYLMIVGEEYYEVIRRQMD